MTAELKIRFMAGDEITKSAKEAIRISEILNVNVVFKFNDVTCCVAPGSNPDLLADRYWEELDSEKRYKMAFGW